MTSLVLPGETLWSVLNLWMCHITCNLQRNIQAFFYHQLIVHGTVTLQYARILFLARLVRGVKIRLAPGSGEMTH